MSHSLFKALFISQILILLAACTTTPVKPVSEMVISNGLVIGSIHAEDAVGLVFVSDSGKKSILYAINGYAPTKEISGWLAPGEYSITQFLTRGPVNNNRIAIPKGSLPTINVKAGEIVDLNHLIPFTLGAGMYTFVSKVRKGKVDHKMLSENADLFADTPIKSWVAKGKVIQSKIAFGSSGQGALIDLIINSGMKKMQGNQINPLSHDATHEDAYPVIKALSQPSTDLITDENGNSYFGTILGQIRYKTNGEWGSIDTGHLEAVVALDVSYSTITAGLESGKIIESKDEGKTFKQIFDIVYPEIVMDIRTISNTRVIGAWDPEAQNSQTKRSYPYNIIPAVSLYKEKNSNFEKINTVHGTKVIGYNYKPDIENIGEDIFIAFPPKTIYKVNLNSSATNKLILTKTFSGVAVNQDKNLLNTWLAKGMFSNAMYSDDLGTNWLPLPKPPFQPTHIHLNSATDAYMWESTIGVTTTAFALNKMSHSAKKWKEITKSTSDCRKILMNFNQDEHYCVLPSGGLKTFINNEWR